MKKGYINIFETLESASATQAKCYVKGQLEIVFEEEKDIPVESNNEIYQKYLEYVCASCFHSLDECTCRYRPTTLFHIDRNIQDCIRVLNEKGYMTRSCCESHYENGITEIYILFVSEHPFRSLPEGFKANKIKNRIGCMMNTKVSKEQYEVTKKDALNKLLEWCKELRHVREVYGNL